MFFRSFYGLARFLLYYSDIHNHSNQAALLGIQKNFFD